MQTLIECHFKNSLALHRHFSLEVLAAAATLLFGMTFGYLAYVYFVMTSSKLKLQLSWVRDHGF